MKNEYSMTGGEIFFLVLFGVVISKVVSHVMKTDCVCGLGLAGSCSYCEGGLLGYSNIDGFGENGLGDLGYDLTPIFGKGGISQSPIQQIVSESFFGGNKGKRFPILHKSETVKNNVAVLDKPFTPNRIPLTAADKAVVGTSHNAVIIH